MVSLNLLSSDFLAYRIVLEIFFAVITLFVGIYAMKIYKLTKQRQPKIFGIAFLFISANYFIQSILNLAIISRLSDQICTLTKIENLELLNLYGTYAHLLLFMVGIVLLAYMTLQIKSKKTLIMIALISLLSIIFSTNKIYLFYVLSSLFLTYISFYYLNNYLVKKEVRNFLVFVAFIFLLFGNVHFIISVNHFIYYIIGSFLELAAYILVLINFILIFKNGKAKQI